VFTAPGGFPIRPIVPVPAYPTPGESAAGPGSTWARPWTELGVGYPGATGEVLRGKWVTFHERDPLLI
jgi:hypothetical protein